MKKERLLYLDLIKLVAVIMVFTIHFTRTLEYAQINFTTHVLPDTLFGMYLGSYGVTLFFIVSGAVLMYIYGDKEIDLASYYKKRFLGIYPMFWLAFAIFFTAKEIVYPGFAKGINHGTFLFTLLGIDGQVGVYTGTYYLLGEWFLTVIIIMYLIFPFLKKLVLSHPVWTFIIFTLATIASAFNWFDCYLAVDAYFFHRIPEILFGMIFIQYFKKTRWYMLIPSLAVLAVLGIFDFPNMNKIVQIWLVGYSSFIVLAFVFSFLKGKVVEFISHFIDKFCYPIFLTHHIIMLTFITKFALGRTLGTMEVWLVYLLCWTATLLSSALLVWATPKLIKLFSFLWKRLGKR